MEANVDGYSFHVHGDSDCGVDSDSSVEQDDEIEILLHGTPEQKRRVYQKTIGGGDSSSEDDFEKLMENELNAKMENIKKEFYKEVKIIKDNKNKSANLNEYQSCSNSKSDKNDYYNDVYFDSDDETDKNTKIKRKKFTNDELFYDPDADTEDELWVKNQREKLKIKHKNKKDENNVKPLPNSDAVLNCPSCMSTLCLDCQRHSTYTSQYRAMFVMNCIIKHDELLHYKKPQKKTFKRHRNRESNGPMSVENFEKMNATDHSNTEMTYNPVNCTTCGTEVAVYDNDEIYHFFNVLASHA